MQRTTEPLAVETAENRPGAAKLPRVTQTLAGRLQGRALERWGELRPTVQTVRGSITPVYRRRGEAGLWASGQGHIPY